MLPASPADPGGCRWGRWPAACARSVERRHEHGGGRVGERHPLVPVARARLSPASSWVSFPSGAAAAIRCSRQSLQQRRRRHQLPDFLGREPGREGLGEPLVRAPACPAGPAGTGDRQDHPPALPRSGCRSTRPRASRAASVAPIDCGLICSSLASAPEVAGPLRSSRAKAELSGKVSVLDPHLSQPPQQQADALPERPGDLVDVQIPTHAVSRNL